MINYYGSITARKLIRIIVMLSVVNSLLMIVTIKTVFASIDNSIPAPGNNNINNNNNKINEMIDTIRRVEEMHKIELTQSSNLQRQELLQQVCERLGSANKTWTQLKADQMDHLLVDKAHKLLYCYVPKVACTNWKRVMMVMSGKWNTSEVLQIPASLAHSYGMFDTFSSLSPAEKEQVLTNYTRFMVARHPFERLLSAFRNKLEGDLPSARYFQSRIGKLIVKHFRPHAKDESLTRGHDVTFNEFIQYLLTPELSRNLNTNSSFNEHWESIAQLCHPCVFKYNVIGKYESLADDAMLLLNLIGARNVTFPMSQRTSGTSAKLIEYYEQLPIRTIRSLFKLYEIDFKMFGYGLEDILGIELG